MTEGAAGGPAGAGNTAEAGEGDDPSPGLPRALGLTLASALVWGTAHLAAGRKITGSLLLTAFALLAVSAGAVAAGADRPALKRMAVKPDWLTGIGIAAVVLAVLWAAVVLWSYLVVRPGGLRPLPGLAGTLAVLVLCAAVSTPLVWAGRMTFVYRDTLTTIFHASPPGRHVDQADPWAGKPRLNVLLLGGDAASDRTGVRTDSMTLASIDTHTGSTVLISLPRNLEHVPMPTGTLAAARFPNGFTGDGPANPGLLNEVFEYAEQHPEIMPGVTAGHRGPGLLKATVGKILAQPVDYYILVDMFGFADIIDAMGGVELTIPQPIPYGRDGRILAAGHRRLNGKDALWYGRSRTLSDDYTRMGRQKCLMRAIARQADPQRVLTKFEKLARAARRTISTDIPSDLLPALVTLSAKVKTEAGISSLQFVPPLIYTGNPDYRLIRALTAQAIAANSQPTATPSPGAGLPAGAAGPPPKAGTGLAPATVSGAGKGAVTGAGMSPGATRPVSLDAVCPS